MIVGVIKCLCTGQVKNIPINFDKFAGFSTDQIKMMISFLQRITEDYDDALQVLLPELIELLFVNIFTISNEEAQQYMLYSGNSYHGRILPDFKNIWKGNLLLKKCFNEVLSIFWKKAYMKN